MYERHHVVRNSFLLRVFVQIRALIEGCLFLCVSCIAMVSKYLFTQEELALQNSVRQAIVSCSISSFKSMSEFRSYFILRLYFYLAFCTTRLSVCPTSILTSLSSCTISTSKSNTLDLSFELNITSDFRKYSSPNPRLSPTHYNQVVGSS